MTMRARWPPAKAGERRNTRAIERSNRGLSADQDRSGETPSSGNRRTTNGSTESRPTTCLKPFFQGRSVPVKILVVGSGGREHALAWKLKQSAGVDQVFCAPGNAGTDEIGENVPINAGDLPALARFAKENRVDLTVIGPDDSLAAGI